MVSSRYEFCWYDNADWREVASPLEPCLQALLDYQPAGTVVGIDKMRWRRWLIPSITTWLVEWYEDGHPHPFTTTVNAATHADAFTEAEVITGVPAPELIVTDILDCLSS